MASCQCGTWLGKLLETQRDELHWAFELTHLLPDLFVSHCTSAILFAVGQTGPAERRVVQVEHPRMVEVNDFELSFSHVLHRVDVRLGGSYIEEDTQLAQSC